MDFKIVIIKNKGRRVAFIKVYLLCLLILQTDYKMFIIKNKGHGVGSLKFTCSTYPYYIEFGKLL